MNTPHFRKWHFSSLADDEITVLGAGSTATEAYQAGLKHTKLPILHRVPETLDLFVGYAI